MDWNHFRTNCWGVIEMATTYLWVAAACFKERSFADIFSSLLLQLCHSAYHLQVPAWEQPHRQTHHPLRAPRGCHHQHGWHCALWGCGSHLHRSSEQLRAWFWPDNHHKVRVLDRVKSRPIKHLICINLISIIIRSEYIASVKQQLKMFNINYIHIMPY